MKTLISYIGILAVVHAAVIPQNFQVNIPVENTRILGPSGSITKLRNLITMKNGDLSSQSTIQEEITNIVGPSGSIKEEKYLDNPSPSFVRNPNFESKYISPSVEVQKVANTFVDLPSEKTSILGPSGSIIQEKNRNSGVQVVSGTKYVEASEIHSSAHNEDCVHEEEIKKEGANTAKHNQNVYLQLKSPVLVQYKFPSTQKIEVSHQRTDLESKVKTNVVGPSGSITQELLTEKVNFPTKVLNEVKNIPAAVKPVIVKHGFSSVPHVAVPYSANNFASEQTSIVGPSGSITQEIHSNKNTPSHIIQPVEFQYAKVPLSHGTYVVSQPSEKSVIIGPSGSITKEVTSNVNGHSTTGHNVVKIVPVAKSGVSIKTDIVGPSGSITQEISSNSNGHIASIPKVVRVDTASKPISSSYVSIGQFNEVRVPSEKTRIIGQSGLITQEIQRGYTPEKSTPATVKTEVRQYPSVSNVALSFSTNTIKNPIEKTSIVGSSGIITQEKYLQTPNHNTVKVTPVVAHVTSPVSVKTGYFQGKHIIVNKSYLQNIPVEKTNIVGPSGAISQEKHILPTLEKTQVIPVQYGSPSVGNVDVTYGYETLRTPSEKTSIVGPSGSITQEINGLSAIDKFNTETVVKSPVVTQLNTEAEDDCDESHDTQSVTPEKTNIITPVNVPFTTPIVVQYDPTHYVQPVAYVEEEKNHNVPIEKSRIVGPSGSVTREQYLPSTVSDVRSPLEVQLSPAAVSYVAPVVKYSSDNAPIEKTNILGPSGSITREQYLQSIESDVQSPLKVQITPVAVSYVDPVVKYSSDNAPIEKTSILGPSGSITREQYLQSTKSDVQSPLKVQLTPTVVSYASPFVKYSSDNTPIEKTSILGPSGSITREQYLQSTQSNVQSPSEVQYIPTAISYVSPVVKYSANNAPVEKISILGPSGSITRDQYLQSDVQYPSNVEFTPAAVSYVSPVEYSSDYAPIEKTSILGPSGSIVQEKQLQAGLKTNSDLHFYSTQPLSVVGASDFSPVYRKEQTSIVGPSGSITQEKTTGSFVYHENGLYDVAPVEKVFVPYGIVKGSEPVVKITSSDSNVKTYGPYPPSPKYPNIAAPDC